MAWNDLDSRDSVEWEVDDSQLHKCLRLHLTKPLTSQRVAQDRRQCHAVLTITDITQYRREHETLAKRESAMVKFLKEQGVDFEYVPDDDADVTQSREMLILADYGKKYRSLSRQVIMAQELERKRVSKELHDGLAQSLGVVKYSVEASIAQLTRSQSNADLNSLEEVVNQIKRVLDEVRRISNNLAPSVLDDFGLCVAVDWLCDEFRSDQCELRPRCDTCLEESVRLPENVKIAAFRVIQEALNNVSKHSSAEKVDVSVKMENGGLQIKITDNGNGFDPAAVSPAEDRRDCGFGLRSMRERVLVTGGEFAIHSRPGEGTIITANWSKSNLELMCDESVLDGVDGHG